jgi:hypothetical protein
MNLEELLSFGDIGEMKIQTVINKMEILLEYFKSTETLRGFAPFLDVYLAVTKRVLEKFQHDKSYFNNFEKLYEVDVNFAKLYFDPLKEYLLNGVKLQPWQKCFEYCEKEDGIPVVQMLLGINAHINADLLSTLISIEYKEKDDYFKVNDILLELIPQVMKNLALEYKDIYGFGGYIARLVTRYEFEKTIVKWRSDVWENFQNIKLFNDIDKLKQEYHTKTEDMADEIISAFKDINSIVKSIRGIKKINSLELKLIQQ